MSFEKEIRVAVTGRGPANPASLPDLIGAIDAQQKLIVTRDELGDGLRALLEAGDIRELPGHRYIDSRLGPGSMTFTPITDGEMAKAGKEYTRGFWAAYKRLEEQGVTPDEVMWPKLRAEYKLAHGNHATEAEMDEVEALASALIDHLDDSDIEADIGGFTVGPGVVEFDVDGTKDADADRMLGLARPFFAAGAPAGSTLVVREWDPWSKS